MSAHNICFYGERRGGSNEYPQHMFLWRTDEKIILELLSNTLTCSTVTPSTLLAWLSMSDTVLTFHKKKPREIKGLQNVDCPVWMWLHHSTGIEYSWGFLGELDYGKKSKEIWHLKNWRTIMILSFGTDRPRKTVQTQIRLLLEDQSDQGLHCLQFHLHLLDALL